MTDKRELYDFADWEPGEPPNLSGWVRENLRLAFEQFGNGYWMQWSGSGACFEWTSQDWDTDAVIISFGPDDLKKGFIQELDDQFPGPFPASEEQREGVRDVMQLVAQWRSALDEIERHAADLLDRPIKPWRP